MARPPTDSSVLTIRVPASLERRLAREARRRRTTRSKIARAILEGGLTGGANVATEARRQSLLVRRRQSERDTLAFVIGASDISGWK